MDKEAMRGLDSCVCLRKRMDEKDMRCWTDLGVVETIYEEECEVEDSSSTPSLSPSISPPIPLHSSVKAWSLATGHEADVVIHLQGSIFYLHKDPLASKSGYLKRQLRESSEITLSPPLNITAHTFAVVVDFCYGCNLVISPFNVAALRTAAELLEMTGTDGAEVDNLVPKTEAYFRQAVSVNREYASIVFRSCLALLPEAETAAALVSRCIQALSSVEHGGGVTTCIEDVTALPPEDFQIIAESMHRRMTESHDVLYGIVDLYLKKHGGKITDDQKNRTCNCIDCSMLSPQVLMHAVQNPRMPLRFVVQAMFVEQLNTRRSIFSAADCRCSRKHNSKNTITLGAILQRDAALRQMAQLKVEMDATSSRIQSLEKELEGMKKLLLEHESLPNGRRVSEPGRSASFRLCSENKIEREERVSVSSASFRIITKRESAGVLSPSSEESCDWSPRVDRSLGWKLMNGLKSAFRASKQKSTSQTLSRSCGDGDRSEDEEEEEDEDANGNILVIKKSLSSFHVPSRPLA